MPAFSCQRLAISFIEALLFDFVLDLISGCYCIITRLLANC